MGDERSVAKKVKPGTLELDEEERSIIVNCFIETTVSVRGQPVSRERKAMQKTVPVPVPSCKDDCIPLAEEVVRSCKYITKAQQGQVEELLLQLYGKTLARDGYFAGDGQDEDMEEASMDNLEAYIELLYEGQDDMSEKIKGTQIILQLCQDVGNLSVLVQDHTLMGALSRVLNDEYRKSMELTYNIMLIFLAFSNFVEMHDLLANYRVGSITLKVVEMELKKAEHWDEERKKTSDEDTTSQGQGSRPTALVVSGAGTVKDSGRVKILTKKQDKLLLVCLYVLLNLASDVNIEKKMVKKKLTEYLIALLDRVSYDLLLLVITFIKKLSIYEENMIQMRESDLVARLVRLVPCSHDRLVDLCLRLLFNLSFDAAMREQMVKNSIIPKLVDLLKKPPFRAKVLRLLYHLSVDDRCKSMFTYTEAIPLVKELVINFPRNMLTQELAALAVNLTWNGRNAELMCQKGGLKRLIERVVDKKDPLLMKVIRNLSCWTLNTQFDLSDPAHEYRYRSLWSPHLKPLVSLMLETDNGDLLVEVLGTLGCLTPLDLPLGTSWTALLYDYDVLSFCKRLLVPGMAPCDVVLDVIVMIGAFALDPAAGGELASSGIVRAIHEVWLDKADDSEVVLQSLFTLYRFLRLPETREVMLFVDYKDKRSGVQQTRMVLDIMEALNHCNPEVRKTADLCLDLIMEFDRDNEGRLRDLGSQIRRKRYEAYNREWCELINQEEIASGNDDGLSAASYESGNNRRASQASRTGGDGPRETDWAATVFRDGRLALDMNELGTPGSSRGQDSSKQQDEEDEEEEEDQSVEADEDARWRSKAASTAAGPARRRSWADEN